MNHLRVGCNIPSDCLVIYCVFPKKIDIFFHNTAAPLSNSWNLTLKQDFYPVYNPWSNLSIVLMMSLIAFPPPYRIQFRILCCSHFGFVWCALVIRFRSWVPSSYDISDLSSSENPSWWHPMSVCSFLAMLFRSPNQGVVWFLHCIVTVLLQCSVICGQALWDHAHILLFINLNLLDFTPTDNSCFS